MSEIRAPAPPLASPSGASPLSLSETVHSAPDFSDFVIQSCVGSSNVGKTYRTVLKSTKRLYSMKIIKEESIQSVSASQFIMMEKDIMTRINHPFVNPIKFIFKSKSKIYLISPYYSRGSLQDFFLPSRHLGEEVMRVLGAEIILGLEELHQHSIIHKNLKPSNILIGNDNHIVINDYGSYQLYTNITQAVPNPYISPELLQQRPVGPSCDFWGLGLILYQVIVLSDAMSPDCHSLLMGLLTRDSDSRLGSGPLGVEQIKQHPFFRSLHFDRVLSKDIPPPLAGVAASAPKSRPSSPFTPSYGSPIHEIRTSRDFIHPELLNFSLEDSHRPRALTSSPTLAKTRIRTQSCLSEKEALDRGYRTPSKEELRSLRNILSGRVSVHSNWARRLSVDELDIGYSERFAVIRGKN